MVNVSNDHNIRAWTDASQYVIKKYTDDGDFYRQHVINPALFSLLGNVKGKEILDAGSGEGYLCRLLTKQGAKMTGLEPSKLIEYAINKEREEKVGITYIKADLSKWDYKSNHFDSVVSNMVFMDIPDYKSAIKNCIKVLKPTGSFVFSISHPCFDEQEEWQEKPYVEVKNYFKEYKIKNYIGYSFHHTLSAYINLIIEEKCVINKILEPQLPTQFLKQDEHYERDKHVPNFLLIKAIKEQ